MCQCSALLPPGGQSKWINATTKITLPSCFFFPADLRCRRVLPGDHVDVGGSRRVCLFQLFPQLAHRRLPDPWRGRLQVSVAAPSKPECSWETPLLQSNLTVYLRVCFCNSKILKLLELPASEQKSAEERLNQKNGDIQHSTEKLPNGPDAAPSMSTNHWLKSLFQCPQMFRPWVPLIQNNSTKKSTHFVFFKSVKV